MPYQILKPEVVIDVYLSTIGPDGIGSARKTAEILWHLGYANQVTHKPVSKQAVLECMRKSERGKWILKETSRSKWKTGRYA